jgi:uncharacterized protein
MLSVTARHTLLDIAARTVAAAVRGDLTPKFDVHDPELQHHQGAFVTLNTGGRLRGCIGQFIGRMPLWQVVRDMADAAATRDSRFYGNQLTPADLAALQIDISVLSPLTPTDDPLADIEPGEHGIYIRRGRRTGCYLPQVATETGWGAEEFLSHCCASKAGLPPDAWREDDTEVLLFTAEVFENEA